CKLFSWGISILLAVGTPSTGSGKLYCQWELSSSSGNALCILFPTLPEANHCQPPQYTVNHPIFNAHNDLLNANNDLLNSQYKITIAQNKLMEQLTSMYAMILACCDDDDDHNSAITPNELVDSLSMGNEHLNTISATESDEFLKSCVENLVPNLSESKGESECDMSAHEEFTTFLNILFNADYEFDSSDDRIPENLKTLAKGFYPPSLHFLSFSWEL
nr:hypothetical protein [Tanacetum cinerariifolium]